jgi:hypothetical protein
MSMILCTKGRYIAWSGLLSRLQYSLDGSAIVIILFSLDGQMH